MLKVRGVIIILLLPLLKLPHHILVAVYIFSQVCLLGRSDFEQISELISHFIGIYRIKCKPVLLLNTNMPAYFRVVDCVLLRGKDDFLIAFMLKYML